MNKNIDNRKPHPHFTTFTIITAAFDSTRAFVPNIGKFYYLIKRESSKNTLIL